MTSAHKLQPAPELRDLIRDTIKQQRRRKSLQPEDIAEAVARNTPDDLLYDYYQETLRPLIVEVMRLDRNAAINKARNRAATRTDRPISANLEAIRAIDWELVFRERVDTPTGWKLVGDCTAEDLDYCADNRRRTAEQTLAKAEFYEDLARRMRKHNVTRARDLSGEELP